MTSYRYLLGDDRRESSRLRQGSLHLELRRCTLNAPLPHPEAHIRRLVRPLKPGGILAIQDCHRETFAMAEPGWPAHHLFAEKASLFIGPALLDDVGRKPR